jgi:hypothetical protein
MKQYNITNIENGSQFQILTESNIQDLEMQPEWGANPSIEDATSQHEAEQRRLSLQRDGKNSRLCCDEITDLIGGYNLSRAFTSSEINQLLTEFSAINSYLKNFMPRSAKPLIESSPITSTLTQQLKDDILAIFTKYSI